MAFSFTVEDGSADPDANSYVDTDYATGYIDANHFASGDWDALEVLDQQKLLVRSSKYLDRIVAWNGDRVDAESGLRWPRSGVYDADGFEIAPDSIPSALLDAVCEMAVYLMSSDWTNLEGSRGIKEVRVDVIDVRFDTAMTRGSVPFTVRAMLEGLGIAKSGNRPGFKKIIPGMSLRDTIKSALKQGYAALGDLPRAVTYCARSGAPIRDIAAGTSTLDCVDYPLKQVLIVRFSQTETDRDRTLLTDEKMIILSDDLPVQPTSADVVLDEDGATWEVVSQMRDPARVVTILRVRSSR